MGSYDQGTDENSMRLNGEKITGHGEKGLLEVLPVDREMGIVSWDAA